MGLMRDNIRTYSLIKFCGMTKTVKVINKMNKEKVYTREFRLMNVELNVPNHTTLSRRNSKLKLSLKG